MIYFLILVGFDDVYIEHSRNDPNELVCVVATYNYPTVSLDKCLLNKTGKYYFEVSITNYPKLKETKRKNHISIGVHGKQYLPQSCHFQGNFFIFFLFFLILIFFIFVT